MNPRARFACCLGVCMLAGAAACAQNERGTSDYPDYEAARVAQQRGDCDAMVYYLNRYLEDHPALQDSHPDFYWALREAMAACRGGLVIRGVEAGSTGADPLPAPPPG